MTSAFISQRKADLKKKKAELEEQLKSFASKDKGSANWQSKFPKITDSDEDRTDEVEEYENILPVEYTLEEDLRDVNNALNKIEKGTYGKCDNCNREISEERLIILPEAITCLDCDKKRKKKA
jgi:DnaK suppressor protein